MEPSSHLSSCQEKWAACLQIITESLPAERIQAWFMPIIPLKYSENVLTIQVPSSFFYEWIEDNYLEILRKAIRAVLGEHGKLTYSILSDQEATPPQAPFPVLHSNQSSSSTGSAQWDLSQEYLHTRYTFDTFVKGKSNRLAYELGYSLADHMGKNIFNPLMIYGGVGLGKTHLLQAIAHRMRDKKPTARILYLSAERFITQFVSALRQKKMHDFHTFYTEVDVLLLDDIQFMKHKEKTQEIFFHIFNTLHQRGKQLVLTCDTSPRDLEGVHERLLSRFKWGVTAYLEAPDEEMRQEIIAQKSAQAAVQISEEVSSYLAQTVSTNIRDMEGVLTSLVAHVTFTEQQIDMSLAKETVARLIQVEDKQISIPHIQQTVSEYFQLSPEELCAKSRRREIVQARNIAIYFSKSHTPHSLKRIGTFYGRRDHSTVLHALRTIEDRAKKNPSFKHTLSIIQDQIERHKQLRPRLQAQENVSVS